MPSCDVLIARKAGIDIRWNQQLRVHQIVRVNSGLCTRILHGPAGQGGEDRGHRRSGEDGPTCRFKMPGYSVAPARHSTSPAAAAALRDRQHAQPEPEQVGRSQDLASQLNLLTQIAVMAAPQSDMGVTGLGSKGLFTV